MIINEHKSLATSRNEMVKKLPIVLQLKEFV